jgi:hypothetical protein
MQHLEQWWHVLLTRQTNSSRIAEMLNALNAYSTILGEALRGVHE